MKKIILILSVVCSTFQLFAQSDIETIVREGIKYHDQGKYELAIQTYKKALDIDPNSALVNYEIAFSFSKLEEHRQAIKYADVVLKQKADHMMSAYLVKANALDMLGKTKESIKLFNKAIKKEGEHYLLYFNLGINYYKIGDFDNTEKSILNALRVNPFHPGSHLVLAEMNGRVGNSVQSILASSFFLLLEPTTSRSDMALELLDKQMGAGVTKDSENENTININLFVPKEKDKELDALRQVELFRSLSIAANFTEENKDKTQDELFLENMQSLFKVLGEMNEKKFKSFWWTFYAPFYDELAQKDQIFETFIKYITQKNNKDSKEWVEHNDIRLEEFNQWFKKYTSKLGS